MENLLPVRYVVKEFKDKNDNNISYKDIEVCLDGTWYSTKQKELICFYLDTHSDK